MKVALVAHFPSDFNKPRGGVEGVVRRLALYFAREGIECHLVAEGSDRECVERTTEGITVHRLRRSRLPGPISFCTTSVLRIRSTLNHIRPDITHVHGPAVWAALAPAPAVLTVHGATEREVLYRHPVLGWLLWGPIRLVESTAFRLVRVVIQISPYANLLRRVRFGQRSYAIANPIDEAFFTSPPEVAEVRTPGRNVLWVGNEGRRKNLRLFIELMGALARRGSGVTGTAYGASSGSEAGYMKECEALITELNLQGRVRLGGVVSPRAMRAAMDSRDVLVVTSLQETAPCAISEAHARGMYVFAPGAFGIPHMVPDDTMGTLYDASSTVEVIAELLEHALERATDSRRSDRAQMARQYDPNVVGRETVRVYDDLRRGVRSE